VAQRRVYTDADKARIKILLDANAGNIKRTARETGVAIATIRSWRDKWEKEGLPAAVAEVLPAVQAEIAENINRVRDKLLIIIEEKADRRDINTRDAIMGFGVLTDKSRLIEGKATSRTEHEGAAGSLPVEQVRELFAGFAQGIVEAAVQRDAAISSATEEETIDAEWSEQAIPALTP
jgi:transposase-like protein